MVGRGINTQQSKGARRLQGAEGGSDFDRIVSSATSHGLHAEAHRCVAGCEIARHTALGAELRRDLRFESPIRDAVETVEVGCGSQLAVRDAEANLGQFALGQIAAHDRTTLRAESRIAPPELTHRSQERVIRGAEHIAENEVRPARDDLRDDAVDIGIADRKAPLAYNLAARLRNDLAGKAVHLPAPDIVCSGEIDASPVDRQHVLEEREQVLVRAGPRIDHIRVGLEAFIGANVPKQRVVLLDDGNDVLARLRRHRADHVPASVLEEHFPSQLDVTLARTARIAEDRLD